MAQNVLITGPQTLSDGNQAQARGDKQGGTTVSELNARYYENSYRGATYYCCNSAAQALSLTGTTTYTGLVLYNRPGSGKNLAILNAAFAPTIAETGVGAVILFSQPVASTVPSLTTTNVANGATAALLSGNQSSVAQVASSCTLATNPVFLRPLIGIPWVTATAQAALLCKDEIAGELIVPPGAAVGFVAITTAITGVAYISWNEINQ
jgi:hypothetical protein